MRKFIFPRFRQLINVIRSAKESIKKIRRKERIKQIKLKITKSSKIKTIKN